MHSCFKLIRLRAIFVAGTQNLNKFRPRLVFCSKQHLWTQSCTFLIASFRGLVFAQGVFMICYLCDLQKMFTRVCWPGLGAYATLYFPFYFA